MAVSVIVLTKNEQQDLPACLDSVSWSDDIVVFDSYSDDGTIDVAKRYGARVVQRRFDNWAAHQNWGLKNIEFKNRWVFYIDADERVSPRLRDAILDAVAIGSNECVAYRVMRRDFWGSTWLKHVQASSLYIRLFRPEFISYERLVNPVTRVNGAVGGVDGYLDHYPFSKGVRHWIERHNSYSDFEASQIIENSIHGVKFSIFDALFSRDVHIRRYNQKEIFYKIPGRPFVKFFILYFFRLGFLDGKAGFLYAVLQSVYELFIVLKVSERKR